MAYSAEVVKWFLVGKGMNARDAELFSQQPWVQNFDKKTAPKGMELNPESITKWKQEAKKSGVPFVEYAQQKLAPQTIQTAAAGPPAQAGVAAAAQAAADIPQPTAPTPTVVGDAPQAPAAIPSMGGLLNAGVSGGEQPAALDATGFNQLPNLNTDPTTYMDPRSHPGVDPGVAQRYGETGFLPASIRLNNTGAISRGYKDPATAPAGFIGTVPRPANEGGVYAKFAAPEYGIAAAADLLARKYNGMTPNALVKLWAAKPGADYAPRLAKALGIGVNDPIDTTDPQVQKKLLMAQSGKESGFGRPTFSEDVYERAVNHDFTSPNLFDDVANISYTGEPVPTPPDGVATVGGAPDSPYLGAFLKPGADVQAIGDPEQMGMPPTPVSFLGEPSPSTVYTPPAPAPEPAPNIPPPSSADAFAGNVEPPPFTQGPTAAPPTPMPPVLGGGVGYDALPPSADPSMMQRPLEPQLGPLAPPVLGAPVLGGMGSGLASNEDALGPLIDPSMPLPTRAPTPPIVGMPMSSQSMMQAPLEPQLPTSPMQIPTRSTYSSNMSPIDQPPMSSFDPATAPPLGAPSYDMANTFSPATPQYDMANQFSPSAPPLAAPQNPYTMENDFSYDMANKFSPAPTPPATPQYDMANQFSPSTPQFDMANTFTPTPSGGPPGTVPSSTEPSTFVPSGFGVASSSGFTPFAPPSATENPFVYQPKPPTPPPVDQTAGFDPTQGAPGVGGVPAMPSWAIPGAFGMPGAGPGNIGGLSPMQYAGGTSVPTSMASSTGAYTGLGTNPATLGIPGMTSPMLGMTGPGPQPGMTDWSKTGRLTGGIGGGPISEGASPAPAGNAASSAAMESHARALMLSQHAADVANAYQNLAPRMVGAPVRSTISGSSMLGLTGRPSIMQSDLIRPYGMNVGFNPSFGSRF